MTFNNFIELMLVFAIVAITYWFTKYKANYKDGIAWWEVVVPIGLVCAALWFLKRIFIGL